MEFLMSDEGRGFIFTIVVTVLSFTGGSIVGKHEERKKNNRFLYRTINYYENKLKSKDDIE